MGTVTFSQLIERSLDKAMECQDAEAMDVLLDILNDKPQRINRLWMDQSRDPVRRVVDMAANEMDNA